LNVQLAPRTLALILTAVIAVLAAGGWFGLVAAQRSTSSSLDTKAADAQAELTAALQQIEQAVAAQKAAAKAKAAGKGKAASKETQPQLLRVAFPSDVGMPSILLQVQRLAVASGVSLESFAPSMPTPVSGYSSIPINVTVNGRYREIQRFVKALRVQAGSSQGGQVRASGRLFTIETVGITAASEGLPNLTATILLDAYVYTGVVPPVEGETTEAGTDGSTPTPAEGTS
jgi:Tfp pilus assembly protein PilO